MKELIIKWLPFALFAIALLFYKLKKREVDYGKVAMICISLVLVNIAFSMNAYIAYFLQLFLLASLAFFSREYFKRGLFRRRKQMYELYRGERREHRQMRNELYPHVRALEEHERDLDRKLEEIRKVEADLDTKAAELRRERDELEQSKETVKEAHLDVVSRGDRK